MKVVVTDAGFPDLAAERQAALAGGATFERAQCRKAKEVAKAVQGAHVAVVQFAPFTDAAAAAMVPGGRVIRYGVGYDNLDLAAIRDRGLSAAYVPDYCTDEVADHTAAAILTLLRRLVPLDAAVRAGGWDVRSVASPMVPMGSVTAGFLGFGRIPRAVAKRLAGFGMRLIAHDPAPSPVPPEFPVEMVDEATLLSHADILSLHAPARPETQRFLNRERLSRIKPTAFVVNTARGELVDEAALADALTEGALAGALLDVFSVEPLPAYNPLRSAPNILLTPHAAWYSDAAMSRLQALVADEIARALAGQDPRCPIPGT